MSDKIFDTQFIAPGLQLMPKQAQTVYVVVAKPTRVCNADCAYCSSPPLEEMGSEWAPEWNFNKFKLYFDKVYPYMIDGAYWIWHGGEPMLMGHQFYRDCFEYAESQFKIHNRRVLFSMQSNLLGYNKQWKEVFSEIFGGSVSTSFDPDEHQRTIKGNPKTYAKVFKRVINEVVNDGFRPMVIGVYSEETAPLMHKMYDWSLSLGNKAFPLRFNYCHPTGRFESTGEAISPLTYGNTLIELYNRWIKDVPDFTITPLDQMFRKVIGIDGEGHCPWTRRCGGRFVEIEPNGDVYNCSDFADLGNKYCFGNLGDDITLEEMFNTKAAHMIKRRATHLPASCQTCEHFDDCEGGCMRDAELYNHGLYGKFHYCQSWKMVFARIKESILLGEADKVIEKYGYDPKVIRNFVKQNIQSYFTFTTGEWNGIYDNGLDNVYGFGDNFEHMIQESNYNEKGEYLLSDTRFVATAKVETSKLDSINKKLHTIKLKVINQ